MRSASPRRPTDRSLSSRICWSAGSSYLSAFSIYGLDTPRQIALSGHQAYTLESREMLGIIGKLRENGLHHARTAQTRRSPAMRVQPAMEVEERPDAASSTGSPCSPTPQVLHALVTLRRPQ